MLRIFLSAIDLLILFTGDFIFPLRIFLVLPSFSSTNFSSFSHLETMILGVTGVEQPSCLLDDLSLMPLVSGSRKLELVLARLERVDLLSVDRKEETLDS